MEASARSSLNVTSIVDVSTVIAESIVGMFASIAGDDRAAGDVVNGSLKFPAWSLSTTNIGICRISKRRTY